MPGTGRELFHAAHYNMLAKRIRELREEFVGESDNQPERYFMQGAEEVLDELVKRLSDWFAGDNPRFEPDKWLEATRGKGGE